MKIFSGLNIPIIFLVMSVFIFQLACPDKFIYCAEKGSPFFKKNFSGFKDFYKKQGLYNYFQKPLLDFQRLMKNLAIYRNVKEKKFNSNQRLLSFFTLPRRGDKDKVYLEPSLKPIPKAKYKNTKGASLLYKASSESFLFFSSAGTSLISRMGNRPGDRLIEYSLAQSKSTKDPNIKGYHIQSASHLATGSIDMDDMIKAVELLHLSSEMIYRKCYSKSDNIINLNKNDKNSCFWQKLKEDFPHLNKFLKKYFRLNFIGYLTTENGKEYFKFSLNFALDIKTWKKKFPKAWKRNAYAFKNFEYKILFRDSKGVLFGGFQYSRKKRTWKLWFKTNGRQIHPYYSKTGHFIPSLLKSKRFIWDFYSKLNLYGVHITWHKLRLLVDYRKGAKKSLVRMKWHKDPKLEVRGKFVGLFPPWFVDILIPGTIDKILQDYIKTLSGKLFGTKGWNMELAFIRKNRLNRILSLKLNFDSYSHRFFQLIMRNQVDRVKSDNPSFSELFFQSLYLESR